jgi:hypothetical protein
MVDLQETPAVPPTDTGGDERIGFQIAGILLIALGWGVAVVGNLLLHHAAGAGGLLLGPVRITSRMGSFAWAAFGFGVFTGIFGVLLLWVARSSPRGPFVLPGYPY